MSNEQFLTPIERIAYAAEVLAGSGGLPDGGGSSQPDSGDSSTPTMYDMFIGFGSTGALYQKYPIIMHQADTPTYYGLVIDGSSLQIEMCSNISEVANVSATHIDITFTDTSTSQNFTQSYYATYAEALENVPSN